MSITKLTDTNISELVTDAYKQAFTNSEFNGLDLTIFNEGEREDIIAKREKFTGALIAQISKTYYIDRFKINDMTSPYFVDEQKYGAITQWISVSLPEAKENSAMRNFNNGDVIGTFTVALPTIVNHIYETSSSWALPLTITGQQWDTAFTNEQNLNSFVMFLMSQFEGNAKVHDYELGNQNRNALISRKIELTTENKLPKGYINLISEYAKDRGLEDGVYNWSNLKYNDDFLTFCLEYIGLIYNRFPKHNSYYSDFEPYSMSKSDIVTELNDKIWTRIQSRVAKTFRNNWVEPSSIIEVDAWQQLTNSTSIKSGSKTHTDIIGIITDRFACLHTHVNTRVASKYDSITNLTHYERQYVDRYMINLDRKCVILALNETTVTSGSISYNVNGVTITE